MEEKENKGLSSMLIDALWGQLQKGLELFTPNPEDAWYVVIPKTIGKLILVILTILLSPIIITVIIIVFFASL